MNGGELVTPLLIGSGAFAGWSDLKFRRLPNLFCAALAALGLSMTIAGQGGEAFVSHFAHAGIALIVGAALFAFNVIGGGDAKYYAAVAAWFPIGSSLKLLGLVSLAGLALVAVWYGYRLLGNRNSAQAAEGDFAKLPFGIAIALGAVATAWSSQ